MVEVREADCDLAQLVGTEVARLGVELADVVGIPLQPHCSVLRRDAARFERLTLLDARDVVAEDAEQPRDRPRVRIARPLEHRLGRDQHTREVAGAPGVGEREVRRLSACCNEALDVVDSDALGACPGGELVDLARELVQVLADELDEDTRRLGLDRRAVDLELLRDPALEAALRHLPVQHLSRRGHRLRDRSVLLQFGGDERERRRRRRRLQVGRDGLRVRCLPDVGPLDDDQAARVGEEAERVAGRDDVLSRRLRCREELDRIGLEAPAEPLERPVDLRTVGSGEQVGGLQLVGHRRQA